MIIEIVECAECGWTGYRYQLRRVKLDNHTFENMQIELCPVCLHEL